MYNKNLKSEYLEQTQTNSKKTLDAAISTFRATEPYETKFGKDVCSMNIDEIQETVNGISSMRDSAYRNRYYIISTYIDWCLENGIQGANDNIKKVKPNVNKFKEKTILNPIQLEEFIKSMYGDDIGDVTDVIPITALWLSFSGVRRNDLTKIKSEHIDFEKQQIIFDGETYPVYSQSTSYFKKAMTLNSFIVYRNKEDLEEPMVYDRPSGTELLRGIRKVSTPTYLATEISRRRSELELEKELSLATVYLSGIFFRFYERELAGIKPDFKEFAKKEFELGKPLKNPTQRNKLVKISKIKRSWEKDYDSWKEAHNLR